MHVTISTSAQLIITVLGAIGYLACTPRLPRLGELCRLAFAVALLAFLFQLR